MAVNAGIQVGKDDLEALSLAGGNVENVVIAMIIAKNKDLELSFKQASKMELAKMDVVEEISKR